MPVHLRVDLRLRTFLIIVAGVLLLTLFLFALGKGILDAGATPNSRMSSVGFFLLFSAALLFLMSVLANMLLGKVVLTIDETGICDHRLVRKFVGRGSINWRDVSKLEFVEKWLRYSGPYQWLAIYDLQGRKWGYVPISDLSTKPQVIFDAACYAHSISNAR